MKKYFSENKNRELVRTKSQIGGKPHSNKVCTTFAVKVCRSTDVVTYFVPLNTAHTRVAAAGMDFESPKASKPLTLGRLVVRLVVTSSGGELVQTNSIVT